MPWSDLHSTTQNVPNFTSPESEEAAQNLCGCTRRGPLESTVQRQRNVWTFSTGHRTSWRMHMGIPRRLFLSRIRFTAPIPVSGKMHLSCLIKRNKQCRMG